MRAPPTPARALITVALASVCGCDAAILDDQASLDCDLMGEFSVELGELGEGGERFVAFESSSPGPELVHGLQGGTHLVLAARLRTPDPLDRYEVSLVAELGQPPCDADDCASWTRAGGFETELDEASGQVVETGLAEVEITPLFVVVDNWDLAPRQRLRLDVEDPCGRQASATQTFE